MTKAIGYNAKCAFRIVGKGNSSLAYPTDPETPTPETLSGYDLLPFLSGDLPEQTEQELDDTLGGQAGYEASDIVKIGVGGSVELEGLYGTLNQLILAAFGYERVRTAAVLEFPTAVGGITGSATGGGANYLDDTAKAWVTNEHAGKWVRLKEQGGGNRHEVRRIVSNTATRLMIAPNWGVQPVSGTPYEIAFVWDHQYEFSRKLHVHPITDYGLTNPWDASAYFALYGTLGIDQQIAVLEYPGAMVNSLTLKLAGKTLKVSAELIAFCKNFRTSGRNASSAGWKYNESEDSLVAGGLLEFNAAIFGDAVFRIGDWSSSAALVNANQLGITEFELKINNNLKTDDRSTKSGLYIIEPVNGGKRDVTGSIKLPRHTEITRFTDLRSNKKLMADVVFTGPGVAGSGSYSFKLGLNLRQLKWDPGKAGVDGPGVVAEMWPFRCFQPSAVSAGMPTPSTGADNSEVIVTTRDACPFNFLMGQNDPF